MIRYFVSFTCWDMKGNQGYGNLSFDTPIKIKSSEDIQAIEKHIIKTRNDKNLVKVIILNYQIMQEVPDEQIHSQT